MAIKYSEFKKRNSIFKKSLIGRPETRGLGSMDASCVTWACLWAQLLHLTDGGMIFS